MTPSPTWTQQTEGTGARVSTNAAIEETLGRVDDLVERFGGVVANKYRDDLAKLAAWESACRLERAPRRKGDGAPPPPLGQG